MYGQTTALVIGTTRLSSFSCYLQLWEAYILWYILRIPLNVIVRTRSLKSSVIVRLFR